MKNARFDLSKRPMANPDAPGQLTVCLLTDPFRPPLPDPHVTPTSELRALPKPPEPTPARR